MRSGTLRSGPESAAIRKTPLFLRLLDVLVGAAAITALILALFDFYVAFARHLDDIGYKLFFAGVEYIVLAGLWGAAESGLLHRQLWGWILALFASLAAVAIGAYRMSQSPTLGIVGLYDLGVWSTTTLGALAVGCLLIVFRLFPVRGHSIERG